MAKLLAFSGSLRAGSYNQTALKEAVKGAESAGAEVTVVKLNDYIAPLFSEDIEADSGIPAQAQAFKELMITHDGILLASPEYNGCFTAALKNALDWASRATGDEPMMAAFRGKSAVLMAASPGALGGMRGLAMTRTLLAQLGMTVHATQLTLGKFTTLLDAAGNLVDEKAIEKCHKHGALAAAFTASFSQNS